MGYFDLYHLDGVAPYARQCAEKMLGASAQEKTISALQEDILCAMDQYGFSLDEYYAFRVNEKTEQERKTYITEMNRFELYHRANCAEDRAFFKNKWNTYLMFERFYKRDVCAVTSLADIPAFGDFSARHPSFVVKPIDSSHGKNVRIFTFSGDFQTLLSGLIREYGGKFLTEEKIEQTAQMAAFHPQSVNTVRIDSFRCNDRVEILAAELRMGCGDSFVDNLNYGGCVALIDPNTGIIRCAADFYGNPITAHPDTKVKLNGCQISRWRDLVVMVNEIAQIVPGTRLIGWDLALTEKGWLLVEANRNPQFGVQSMMETGLKHKLDCLILENT